MENSWYIKINGVHHFFCKCGEHNSSLEYIKKDELPKLDIIEFNREEIEELKLLPLFYYYPDNHCRICHNENYLDVNALFFKNSTLYWKDIKWHYREIVTDDFWKVIAFVKIPKVYIKSNNIYFEELELSKYIVKKEGISSYEEQKGYFFQKYIMIDNSYHRINSVLKKEMNKKILELLQNKPTKLLSWIHQKVDKLDYLLFFLKNPNLRSLDMVKWKNHVYFLDIMNKKSSIESCLAFFRNNRSEKSIKKVQFTSYINMMKYCDGYNPIVDYIFSRNISDVNHLHRALNMNIEIKYRLFDDCHIENINHFMDFLKDRYPEKHIVQLWLNITKDDLYHSLVRDSINLFNTKNMRIELNMNFKKKALNIRAIHHELTKHSRRLEKIRVNNMIFSYDDSLIKSEVIFEGIRYKLPRNSAELYHWAEALSNCLSTYSTMVMKGKSIVFGLFKEHILFYAIEIHNHKIIQASTSYNRTISKSEKAKIDRWHKEVYMQNLKKREYILS